MLVVLVSVFKKYMTLKEFESAEVKSPLERKVKDYLESSIADYGKRFAKGRVMRNRDDSIDESKVAPFSDRQALKFLSGLVPEIAGSAIHENVYIGAGDIVINEMNNRVRYHLGRIAALANGYDPDDFRIPLIDWQKPDFYTPYQRGGDNKETLVARSVIFPELVVPTGVDCTYDFARSPGQDFVSLEICGVSYNFNLENRVV